MGNLYLALNEGAAALQDLDPAGYEQLVGKLTSAIPEEQYPVLKRGPLKGGFNTAPPPPGRKPGQA